MSGETGDNPYRPVHLDGEAMAKFIQFGDGEPIPVTDISITWEPKREPAADASRLQLLSGFEGMIPLPTETAVKLLRMVGLPSEADRFEIAAHPDLAELNAQMDGYYGDQA